MNHFKKRVIMSKVVKINKSIFWIILGSSIVSITSVLSYNSPLISYLFAFIFVLLLINNALMRRWDNYLIIYLICFSLSLEYAYFVGEDDFYSLKNIRILGLNLGIWMLFPVWADAIINGLNLKKIKQEFCLFWEMGTSLLVINVIAAIMGILMLIFNDNRILETKGWFSSYLEVFYMHALLPFTIFICMIMILGKKGGVSRFVFKGKIALQACLWGVTLQLVTSRLLGVYGSYDGLETLMSSSIIAFLPFMILLSFYTNNIYFKIINTIISSIGIILALLYNGSGKLIISVFLVFIIMYFIINNKSIVKMITVFFAIGFSFFISALANDSNVLLGSKLSQTLSLIKFWEADWLLNMDMSPRMRIAEFVNVFIEYANKPWLILTGKGYGGTIKDHTQFFYLVPDYMMATGFSAKQWDNKLFYDLHEIVNSLLIFGLMWVNFFISTVKKVIKTYKRYPWVIIGAYWILLYYGYSFTITTFGATAYFIGALEVDKDSCT